MRSIYQRRSYIWQWGRDGFDRRGGSVELKSGSNRDVIIRNPIVMHRATETDEMVDPLTVSHSDSDSHLTRYELEM